MIDFHSHILPHMDDGSESVEQTIEMLCAAKEQNIETIVATPHFYAQNEYPEDFFERREKAINELKNCSKKTDFPNICVGAEVYFFDGISRSEYTRSFCIEGTNYLLVEMPFTAWKRSNIDELYTLTGRGITPIIAHIERYLGFKNNKLIKEICDSDLIIQSNAEFFIEKKTQKKALKMLENRDINILGSDCHNTDDRRENLGQAVDVISQKTSHRIVDMINDFSHMIIDNATTII